MSKAAQGQVKEADKVDEWWASSEFTYQSLDHIHLNQLGRVKHLSMDPSKQSAPIHEKET